MRTYAIMIALMITWAPLAHSQEHETEIDDCTKYRSLYYQYLEGEAYRDARTFWLDAIQTCGGPDSMDYKFYRNGRVIYIKVPHLIPDEDTARLELHKDSINWIFEQGMKFTTDTIWRFEYAQYLIYRKDPRTAKIDSLFSGIEFMHHSLKSKFIVSYYRHLIENHYNKAPSGEKEAAIELIVSKFFPLRKMCFKRILETEDSQLIEKHQKVLDFMERYFVLMFSDPNDLLNVLDQQFSNLHDNNELRYYELDHSISLMNTKDCERSGVYVRYVRDLVRIDSSAKAFERLGDLELEVGNYKEAVEAFNIAIEKNPERKNDLNYQIAKALYKNHEYRKAFYAAKKVKGKYKGKAAILCGDCVAALAQGCGDSSFERKANYWLANDYYVLAHQLGEDVSTKMYLNKAPDEDDIFDNAYLNGDSYLCKCWKEKTIIRTENNDG